MTQENKAPLLFHKTCSHNVELLEDGRIAKRKQGYCDGISFSNRTIALKEPVCVNVKDVSNLWNSAIRFGFTSNDPDTIKPTDIPKYSCPDLTNKPGYWAGALPEDCLEENNTLYFYCAKNGDVSYGIDGKYKGILFGEVTTDKPLWAMIDIYGNTTTLEIDNTGSTVEIVPELSEEEKDKQLDKEVNDIMKEMEKELLKESASVAKELGTVPTTPILVHKTHSANVVLSSEDHRAKRSSGYCDGICFSNRSIDVKERVTICIRELTDDWNGSARIGFTSKDPSTMQISELPKYSCPDLISKAGYWASALPEEAATQNYIIHFHVSDDGRIIYNINRDESRVLCDEVATDEKLWAMIDLYGKISSFEFLGGQEEEAILRTLPPPKESEVDTEVALEKEVTQFKGTSNVKCEVVSQNDSNAAAIYKDFADAGLKVVKVYSIQNDVTLEKFEQEAQNMKKTRPELDLNIKYLYHGTKAPRGQVCEEGLDERMAGRVGHFGRGIYFSDNPNKCQAYSSKTHFSDPDANPYILRCKVIMGDCKVYPPGEKDKTLTREPEKEIIDGRRVYYDSVEGCPKDRKEYVIYEKRRVYIEHVIHYYITESANPEQKKRIRDRSLKQELKLESWRGGSGSLEDLAVDSCSASSDSQGSDDE